MCVCETEKVETQAEKICQQTVQSRKSSSKCKKIIAKWHRIVARGCLLL
jgi:hypothetical protein